ncbi:MAG: DUF1573 domain-containing protein [Planctomycetota bacterium]|nr:DUF1573 domain-containing protein [Planctomycetota bacterium]
MNKPLLIVGLMLAVGAAVIGGVVVLGNHAGDGNRNPVEGLVVPTKFPTQDLNGQAAAPAVDRPVASETGPWPKITYEETTFAFGQMAVHATNEHFFVIRNEGEADLVMKEGKTTCKCTTFDVENKVLKPGEETKLKINWKGGAAPDRTFRHGGPVYTNDPRNPDVNFVVEGEIAMPIELMPQFWSVGNINQDKAGTMSASIASKLDDDFEIESIESPSGKVTVKVSPMSIEEMATEKYVRGFRLDVEIAADIPPGKLEEKIKINLKGIDSVPSITASVTARKYGNFILQPLDGTMYAPDKLILQLGQFPASKGRHARLLLIVDQKGMTDEFGITGIEADPPFLKAALTELNEAANTVHRYAVEISVPPGRPHVQKTDTKRGHITITTNHPSEETIQLDILMHSH